MRMFNPKYIRCIWDDSLKGKAVFYDDSVAELEYEVQNMHASTGKVAGHNADDDKPFVVEGVCKSFTNWRYVYYDPNYEVKVAYYRDGKHVQFKSKVSDIWHDCCVEPCWEDNYEYRIKPDEPEKHAVPATEQEPKKHAIPATEFPSLCGYCIHRLDGCTPEPAGKCASFVSTNEDYFRLQKNYADLVKEHVELDRKYSNLVVGIQGLMHKPVNC